MVDLHHITLDGPEEVFNKQPDIKVENCSQSISPEEGFVKWYHHWRKSPSGILWLSAGRCKDGSYILRFENAVDFLISPKGDLIQYHVFGNYTNNHTQSALFNQVIPMVMNLRGTEVLHASSILSLKGAVTFIGNGGYGKSTLAAGLVQAGLQLLSDDVVPLIFYGKELWTSSGLPRMGLWPHARQLLTPNGKADENPDKSLFKLTSTQYKSGNFPLKHIYFLKPSDESVSITTAPMTAQRTFIELVRAAHRLDLTDHAMLQRQFKTLQQVVQIINAKELIYPASIPDIKGLCSTVIRDLDYTNPPDSVSVINSKRSYSMSSNT